MKESNRRHLLKNVAALSGAALFTGGPALAQLGVGGVDRFDLLIKGGDVLDPSQGLRGRRNIGIRNARVVAVEREIPAEMASQTLDATGRLVLPGLVDLHVHVFPQTSAIGLPADELVPFTATTTYVSAGDAGGNNFSAFKHYVIAQARSRIFAFVHISSIGLAGFPVGGHARVQRSRQQHGSERTVDCSCTGAKKRGVIIDVGHGGGSFSYAVAEPAIQQGLLPDTISSDLHAYSGNSPSMPFLPWVMSKFLNMGFTLEQVVSMATERPAKLIGKIDKLGTLQVGAPADVSIMELVEGPVEFVDTVKNVRTGNRFLKPIQTVRAGRPFGKPFPSPFGYP